jgi:hypothetical protein
MPGIITPSFPSAGAIALAATRAAGLLDCGLFDCGFLVCPDLATGLLLACCLLFAIITSANQNEFKTIYLLVSRPDLQLHFNKCSRTCGTRALAWVRVEASGFGPQSGAAGTNENSPALQRRVQGLNTIQVPQSLP